MYNIEHELVYGGKNMLAWIELLSHSGPGSNLLVTSRGLPTVPVSRFLVDFSANQPSRSRAGWVHVAADVSAVLARCVTALCESASL